MIGRFKELMMKKKLLIAVLVSAMAFVLCGCSQESKAAYKCPDDYQEVSIGDAATYIPDNWMQYKDVSTESLKVYCPPDTDSPYEEGSIVLSKYDKTNESNDLDLYLTNIIKNNNDERFGTLVLQDLDKNESGLTYKHYSYITSETAINGFVFVLEDSTYNFSANRKLDSSLDDQSIFMEIYAYPTN